MGKGQGLTDYGKQMGQTHHKKTHRNNELGLTGSEPESLCETGKYAAVV